MPDAETVRPLLGQLARLLQEAGREPYDIHGELGILNAHLGGPLPEVLSIVRQLPGLEAYNLLDDFAQRAATRPRDCPDLVGDDHVPWGPAN